MTGEPAATVVDADTLRGLLSWPELVDPIAHAFVAASRGDAQTAFAVLYPGDRAQDGDVFVKAGVVRGRPVHVVKVAPWFAVNAREGRPQGGLFLVLDSATGHAVAILRDEHHLSDIRTAAAGAVVARALAPPHAQTALVVGSGTQAELQSLALHAVRRVATLWIWARHAGRAGELAGRLGERLPDVRVEVVDDLRAAVRGADVVVTTTAAREPLIRGEWLHPGQHVTAIGADDETKCELDAEALHRARVFVDERSLATRTGEVRRAIETGGYRAEQLAGEIGELLCGAVAARSPGEITIATLAGIGAQDVAAAELAVARLGA